MMSTDDACDGVYLSLAVPGILLLFFAAPGGNDVPLAMYLVDGSVQILVGVAAVLGLVFSFRPETLRWTREVDESGKSTDPRRK